MTQSNVFIRTLGRLEIHVAGVPLRFRRRAPRRAFQLLTALIAQGGQGASTAALADLLWPEADPFDAHRALTITLHRLRRLLRNPGVVRVVDGQLFLDGEVCGVDVWRFEQALRAARDPAGLLRALDLYGGAFLGDDPSPWALATRRRLARLVARARRLLEVETGPAAEWQRSIGLLSLATLPAADNS